MDNLDRKIKEIWQKSKKPFSGMRGKKCPGDNLLVSYLDGVMRETDKGKFERHLLECNHCLEKVILHFKVKEAEAVEPVPEVPAFLMNRARHLVTHKATKEGFFDIVFKFARETIEIIANPGNLGISCAAPVPVRGQKSSVSADHITFSKTFDDIESEVEMSRVGEKRLNIRICVKDIKSRIPVEGLRISLFDPDREVASFFSKKGEVHFAGCEFGEYMVKMKKKDREIGQMSLKIIT